MGTGTSKNMAMAVHHYARILISQRQVNHVIITDSHWVSCNNFLPNNLSTSYIASYMQIDHCYNYVATNNIIITIQTFLVYGSHGNYVYCIKIILCSLANMWWWVSASLVLFLSVPWYCHIYITMSIYYLRY